MTVTIPQTCCERRMAVGKHARDVLVLHCLRCGFELVLLRQPARLRRAA